MCQRRCSNAIFFNRNGKNFRSGTGSQPYNTSGHLHAMLVKQGILCLWNCICVMFLYWVELFVPERKYLELEISVIACSWSNTSEHYSSLVLDYLETICTYNLQQCGVGWLFYTPERIFAHFLCVTQFSGVSSLVDLHYALLLKAALGLTVTVILLYQKVKRSSCRCICASNIGLWTYWIY